MGKDKQKGSEKNNEKQTGKKTDKGEEKENKMNKGQRWLTCMGERHEKGCVTD